MSLGEVAKIAAVVFLLAFFTETTVEYIFGTPIDRLAKRWPVLADWKWTLMYIAAAVGVYFALYYQLDLVAVTARMAGDIMGEHSVLETPTQTGMVVTGLAIGRGANFVSDLFSRYVIKPKG